MLINLLAKTGVLLGILVVNCIFNLRHRVSALGLVGGSVLTLFQNNIFPFLYEVNVPVPATGGGLDLGSASSRPVEPPSREVLVDLKTRLEQFAQGPGLLFRFFVRGLYWAFLALVFGLLPQTPYEPADFSFGAANFTRAYNLTSENVAHQVNGTFFRNSTVFRAEVPGNFTFLASSLSEIPGFEGYFGRFLDSLTLGLLSTVVNGLYPYLSTGRFEVLMNAPQLKEVKATVKEVVAPSWLPTWALILVGSVFVAFLLFLVYIFNMTESEVSQDKAN